MVALRLRVGPESLLYLLHAAVHEQGADPQACHALRLYPERRPLDRTPPTSFRCTDSFATRQISTRKTLCLVPFPLSRPVIRQSSAAEAPRRSPRCHRYRRAPLWFWFCPAKPLTFRLVPPRRPSLATPLLGTTACLFFVILTLLPAQLDASPPPAVETGAFGAKLTIDAASAAA